MMNETIIGFDELLYAVNEATNGWFVGLIVATLFFVVFSINYNTTRDLGSSMVTSSFINFILSTLFWALGLLDIWVVTVLIVFLVGSVLMRFFVRK